MNFDWRGIAQEFSSLAVLHGLVKRTKDDTLTCMPFALPPLRIEKAACAYLKQLTPLFNTLAWKVAQDTDMLHSMLETGSDRDIFLGKLLRLDAQTRRDKAADLLVTRSDYFFHQPLQSHAPNAQQAGDINPQTLPASALRQVELNTIAAGYAGMSEVWSRVVEQLLPRLNTVFGEGRVVENAPCTQLAKVFAQAHGCYGVSCAVMVMVVQADEMNTMDQWSLHHALVEQGVHTRRYTLDDIATKGHLRDGALWIEGEEVALVYFRAAYGPEDFTRPSSWDAREKIARSGAIEVPSLAVQLAGMKRVQQVLTQPERVEAYLPAKDAAMVRQTFAAMYDLEEMQSRITGPVPVYQMALQNPEDYVLKPMREGGGHNLYKAALSQALQHASPLQRKTWVLMERLHPPPRPMAFFRAGKWVEEAEGVSEIGCFGALLVQSNKEVCNVDAGWLVRSKKVGQSEGGISAGVGYFDSMMIV